MSTDSPTPDERRREEEQSPTPAEDHSGPGTEKELDQQVEDTFPASDPPANY